jgi:hypothetical protein
MNEGLQVVKSSKVHRQEYEPSKEDRAKTIEQQLQTRRENQKGKNNDKENFVACKFASSGTDCHAAFVSGIAETYSE